jgi:hypothetical protein
MTFIYIYIKSPSYWHKTGIFNELDYSIRSVRKNYIGKSRIIVVGDDPKLDVEHVPCERVESSKYGYYRHFDMIKKVKTALNYAKCKEFILMYDDIYLLKPISKRELQKTYAKQRITDLNKYLETRKGDPGYIRCWTSTYNRIQEFRDDLWEWETHLPRYFKTNHYLNIVNKYNLEKVAYLISSLYAAEFGGVPELITDKIQSNVLQDTPLHNDYDKDFSAKFMNVSDDGISQELRNRMKDLFG